MKVFHVMVMAAILAGALCVAPHVSWAGVSVGVAVGIPAPVVAYPAPVYYPPAYYAPAPVYGYGPAVVVGPRYGYYGPHYRHWRPAYGHGHYYRHHR